MDKKETHLKGLVGELEFALHFIRGGYGVYQPLDPNSRADLIVEKEHKFKRIQIKYCTPYKGCLRIELEHPMRKTGPYSSLDVDAIGVFNSASRKFYLLPISVFGPRKELWLRVNKARTEQRKNMNLAEKYLI